MSGDIGTYTFLPWMRRGIARRITSPLGDTGQTDRVGFDVTLQIDATDLDDHPVSSSVTRSVKLYGPGDIIGLDAAAISRIEPPDWTTNFEPNYFPAIEFYDEDLPWRYTPAAPDGRRMHPWLALIVLAEDEFADGAQVAGQPLPHIDMQVDLADVAPPPGELWAWAHVQFNEPLADDVVSDDSVAVAAAVDSVLADNPDLGMSRILCPRKLAPSTAYHAFLVPTFETGRLAGLGYDASAMVADPANGLHASFFAWDTYSDKPAPTRLPIYHRWYFRTGQRGDFEELVRLLEPKVVDSRVGARDIDVSDPSPNIDGIDGPDADGVLRLEGALRAPLASRPPDEQAEYHRFDDWDEPPPHPFQQQLAAFVNLADSYSVDGVAANDHPDLPDTVIGDDDPVVVPPIYGRWHALTERLLTERDGDPHPDTGNWLHELNLDPRWRMAAGYGTTIIQANQERYMDAAWDQIGDVLEANQRIRQAQLATRTSTHWQAQLATADSAEILITHAPLHARVISGGVTVRHQVATSPVTEGLVSSASRRLLRPRGRLATAAGLDPVRPLAGIVGRVNDGGLVTAPPKPVQEDVPSPDDLADELESGGGLLTTISRFVRRHLWLIVGLYLLAVFLVVAALLAADLVEAAIVVLVAATVVAVVAVVLLSRASGRDDGADVIRDDLTPEAVESLPGHSGFTLVTPIRLSEAAPESPATPSGVDNAESIRFKDALLDGVVLLGTSAELGRTPELTPLDLDAVAGDIVAATDPTVTIPALVLDSILLPGRIVDEIGERFVEAMAYPEFDTAMYKPLVDRSEHAFVPNLHLVEPDSVTLLETNQRFIESYMVGLNHEFARELLWREYPTDQRGSYFRQFWDVRTQILAGVDPEAEREELKDIPPLHQWSSGSFLGDHDNREEGRDNEEELVLVIRGELLKKYPNTVISAQPAKWQPKSDTDPTPDKAKERQLDEDAEILTPLYEARVAPDIYFFGFDLTALEARGDDTVDDKPGWFFRIEEVPGDARFGFDVSRDGPINVYNDLAWPDVVPGVVDGDVVAVAGIPTITLIEPTDPSVVEKQEQWASDHQVPFDSSTSAAELAYVALQTPVLMAVHAAELLPDQVVS